MALAGGLLLMGSTANATSLPTCVEPGTCLQFGNFNVYSLPFLNFLGKGTVTQNPGDPYYVASAPGQLANDIVYGTGTNNGPANNNPAGMDNAYRTPDGGTPSYFGTSLVTDPTGDTFTGDAANTWDGRVSAIQNFLITNNSDYVVYFNLNETGSSDTLDGLNLLAWASFTLHDDQNVLPDLTYYLTGPSNFISPADNLQALSDSASFGGPTPNPANPNDVRWSEIHGWICVDSNTNSLISLGSCANHFGAGSVPNNAKDIKQNLGANQAAFAIYNQSLSDILKTTTQYDVLSIDWRMAYEDNGYEQAFSRATTVGGQVVPEPATLGLFGAGLLGLGFASYRRRRKA